MEKFAIAAQKKRGIKTSTMKDPILITREQLYCISHNFSAYQNMSTPIEIKIPPKSKVTEPNIQNALNQLISLLKEKTEIEITEENADTFAVIADTLINPHLKAVCESVGPGLTKTFSLTSQFFLNSEITDTVLQHYVTFNDEWIPTSLWLHQCFITRFFPYYFTAKGERWIDLTEFGDVEILKAIIDIQRGLPFDVSKWSEDRVFHAVNYLRLEPIAKFLHNTSLSQVHRKAYEFHSTPVTTLLKESINELESILASSSMYLTKEEQLGKFLIELYKKKSDALPLFSSLYIPAVPEDILQDFIQKLPNSTDSFEILKKAVQHGYFFPKLPEFSKHADKVEFLKFDCDQFLKFKRENRKLRSFLTDLCTRSTTELDVKIREGMELIRTKDSKENRQKALALFKELVTGENVQKDPEACWRIAAFYIQKLVDTREEIQKETKDLLLVAMEYDIPDAFFWYAMTLARRERHHYLKMAVMQKCAVAMFELGIITMYGIGVTADVQKGKNLILKSGETGDAFCATKVAQSYEYGIFEFEKNEELATKYKQIAEQGNFSDSSFIYKLQNTS